LVIGVTENAHEIVAAVLRRVRRGARSLRVAGVHDASRVVPSADDEDHALFSRVYLIDGTQLGIESHLVRFVARARPKARLRDIASDVANEVSSDPSDQRIISFFVEHGDENRTIAYAAECLDRSVTTLEADVQRICGLDAHELRTWGRLIAAALLLQGTLWSAERIGVELGFGGGSGLATRFREYAGVTPTSVPARRRSSYGGSSCRRVRPPRPGTSATDWRRFDTVVATLGLGVFCLS
jgi:AraC-like DNA-binding protein